MGLLGSSNENDNYFPKCVELVFAVETHFIVCDTGTGNM
jgi:hypothetical protein